MKSNSISKGYTLLAGVDLIFPASFGRNQFFVVNTSTDDVLIAYGENPVAEDFIPIVGENGHIDLQPQPQSRITLVSEAGGSIVVATDVHTVLDDVAPYIVVGPHSASIAVGADIILTVDVKNVDGMAFEWFSSTDGRAYTTTGVTTQSLPLTGVQSSVHYRVEVSNVAGVAVNSERATLTVGKFTVPAAVIPPSTKPTFELTVATGTVAPFIGRFGANVTPGDPDGNNFGNIVPQVFTHPQTGLDYTVIQLAAIPTENKTYFFLRPFEAVRARQARVSIAGKVYSFVAEGADGGYNCFNPALLAQLEAAVGTDVTCSLLDFS